MYFVPLTIISLGCAACRGVIVESFRRGGDRCLGVVGVGGAEGSDPVGIGGVVESRGIVFLTTQDCWMTYSTGRPFWFLP